ncbi:unnamed protein product [Rhizophagus irregularis]|nr:unnamed protein product [Rhizophagus irregularis]
MRVWDQYIVNIACPPLTGTVSEIDQLSWGSSRGHVHARISGRRATYHILPPTLLYDALYVMVKVGHVNVPMSLEQKRSAICKHHRQMKGFYRTWSRISQLHCTIFQGSGYGKSRLIKEIMYKC